MTMIRTLAALVVLATAAPAAAQGFGDRMRAIQANLPLVEITKAEIIPGGMLPGVLVEVVNKGDHTFQMVNVSCRVLKGGETAIVVDVPLTNVQPGDVAAGEGFAMDAGRMAGADDVACRIAGGL
ncbi:MAG: hypothetical protein ACFE0R_13915 [Salinarimonas sp.]